MSKNCRKKKIAPFGDMGSLKLSHVYKVIAQRDLENAHKADADVRACIEIARFIFARCEIIWEVLETLERNYDKALLFTTQNKKEWLSRVTNHL
jgi:exonuclease I